MKRLCLVITLWLLVGGTAVAADPLFDTVRWSTQAVRYPVSAQPKTFLATLPALLGSSENDKADRRSRVTIDSKRALAIELEALEIVRVRLIGAASQPVSRLLKVARIQYSPQGTTVRTDAHQPVDDRITYLTQPPGANGVWLVSANRPTTVVLERAMPRPERGAWELIRRRVLKWAQDDGQKQPPLPQTPGATVARRQLLAEQRVAATVKPLWQGSAQQAQLDEALTAWRRHMAANVLDRVMPKHPPVFRRQPYAATFAGWKSVSSLLALSPDGLVADPTEQPDKQPGDKRTQSASLETVTGRTWYQMEGPTTRLSLEIQGPGVLQIETRALWPLQIGDNDKVDTLLDAQMPRQLEMSVYAQRPGNPTARLLAQSATRMGPARMHMRPRTETAFSRRYPLLTPDGNPVSFKSTQTVTLFPGRNRYTIDVAGGPSLLRLTSLHRQARLRESVIDYTEPTAAAMQAAARITSLPSDNAGTVALRALLQHALGAVGVMPKDQTHWPQAVRDQLLPPTVQQPALPEDWQSAELATIERAWRQSPMDGALRTEHRKLWREQTRWRVVQPGSTGNPDGRAPEPWRYVEVRAPISGQLAAIKRNTLWHIAPSQPQTVVAPASTFAPHRPALLRLFARTEADNPGPIRIEIDGRKFSLVGFSPVELIEFAVTPGPHDIRVETPDGAQVFSAFPVQGAAEAQSGTVGHHAFSRRFWPLTAEGKPLRIAIPQSTTAGPVRLRFRRLANRNGHTPRGLFGIKMHTDIGTSQRFLVNLHGVDAGVLPVRAPAQLSQPAEIVTHLPATTGAVWFTSEASDQLVATVAVRASVSDTQPEGLAHKTTLATATAEQSKATSPLGASAALEAVHLSSQALARRPLNAEALMSRTEHLLVAEQGGQARYDLLRLLSDPALQVDGEHAQRRDTLVEQFDAWLEPTHLRHADISQGPLPLLPAMLGQPQWSSSAVVDLARQLRTGRSRVMPTTPIPSDVPRRYAHARALELAGYSAQAADLLLTAPGWQSKLHAMAPLYAALQKNSGDDKISVGDLTVRGFAAATHLDEYVGHYLSSRALAATARMTRWMPLRRMAHTAGFERLYTARSPMDLTPNATVRWALSGSPWTPSESHVARPGRGAAMDVRLKHPTRVQVRGWCARWRSQARGAVQCPVTFRVNNRPVSTQAIPVGRQTVIADVKLPAGRHRIEAQHTSPRDAALAVFRFSANRPLAQIGRRLRNDEGRGSGDDGQLAIPIQMPGRWHVTRQSDVAETLLKGPAVLRIQARRHGDTGGGGLKVIATAEDSNGTSVPPVDALLALSDGADLSAVSDRRDPLVVTRPTEQLMVLPADNTYRLRFVPEQGAVVFRLYARTGRHGAKLPPLPPPLRVADDDGGQGYQLPVDPLISARVFRHTPTPLWATLSVGLRMGRENFIDRDNPALRPADMGAVTLQWRRRLDPNRTWLNASAGVRWHDQDLFGDSTAALSGDLRARFFTRDVPGGFNLFGGGRVVVQSESDAVPTAWSGYGDIGLSKFFAWGRTTGVLPSLSYRMRHQSLDTNTAEAALADPTTGATIDPLVFNQYAKQHPKTLYGGLTGIWFAFQDQLAMAGVRAASNADLGSLDHVTLHLTWRGLTELADRDPHSALADPFFQLRYAPSYRMADDQRADAYVRHDLGGRLAITLWHGQRGRWLFELRNNVVLSTAYYPRTTFLAGIRFDFTGNRGLMDLLPTEDDFAPLLEPRGWGPLP